MPARSPSFSPPRAPAGSPGGMARSNVPSRPQGGANLPATRPSLPGQPGAGRPGVSTLPATRPPLGGQGRPGGNRPPGRRRPRLRRPTRPPARRDRGTEPTQPSPTTGLRRAAHRRKPAGRGERQPDHQHQSADEHHQQPPLAATRRPPRLVGREHAGLVAPRGRLSSGWVNGYWHGFDDGRWSNWGAWLGASAIAGLTTWGIGSALNNWGYMPYDNPYRAAVVEQPVARRPRSTTTRSRSTLLAAPPAEDVNQATVSTFDQARRRSRAATMPAPSRRPTSPGQAPDRRHDPRVPRPLTCSPSGGTTRRRPLSTRSCRRGRAGTGRRSSASIRTSMSMPSSSGPWRPTSGRTPRRPRRRSSWLITISRWAATTRPWPSIARFSSSSPATRSPRSSCSG